MFDHYLKQVVEGAPLTSYEAYHAASMLLHDDISEVKAAAFLSAMRTRRENEDELLGFVKALKEHCIRMEADVELLDTCGTGGDGFNTFNISTTVALILASCGVAVAKHGNRGATSAVGSSDVLEALGVRIELTPDEARTLLDKTGITILFAPYYHPVLKKMAPLRKGLGIPTLFNFLGPLLNPFDLTYQLLGVSDRDIQPTIARALAQLGRKRALVVRGENGMDEIAPDGPSLVYEVNEGEVSSYHINPQSLGFALFPASHIKGRDARTNATLVLDVLRGLPGPCRDVVLLNAAPALVISGRAVNLFEGVQLAAQAIDSGRAMAKLRDLISYSQDRVLSC